MAEVIRKLTITRTKLAHWELKIRIPDTRGPHRVSVLLHGWTGDEDSMWIFASRIPEDSIVIAPRGLHRTPLGGFSWHPISEQSLSEFHDFRPAVDALDELFEPENIHFESLNSVNFSHLNLIGFSQGAALAYSYGLIKPEKIDSLAGLSGFFPDGALEFVEDRPLLGVPAFIAHGTQDTIVPVERARNSVEMLQMAGCDVSYCEDDVGHKLSSTCFRGLQSFLSE